MVPTNKRERRLAILGMALAAALLSGCDEFAEFEPYRARRDAITQATGDAVRHNRSVHTIDPWPKHAWKTDIGLDGRRAVLGVERYRQGRVAEPKGLGTQAISTEKSGGPTPVSAPAAK